jgi:PhnB protein
MAIVKPIPDGYHTLTPYLTLKGAAQAIDFYKKAFSAEEIMRMPGPGGAIMHAELRIGDSHLMLSEAIQDPPSQSSLFVYVADVDAAFSRATAAGCQVNMPLADQFWGDRFGKLVDPFGIRWSMATHKEDVPPAEMEKRARAAMEQMAAQKK